jgi:hypothetical protein
METCQHTNASAVSSSHSDERSYVQHGYNRLQERLRGVTLHPLGLLLTEFFNNVTDNHVLKIPVELSRYRLQPDPEVVELFKTVSPSDWGKKAKCIDSILTEMKTVLQSRNGDALDLNCLHVSSLDSFLRVQRRVGEKTDPVQDPSVLWMEICSKQNDWWKKVNEAVWNIRDETKGRLQANLTMEPMLLAVFHIGCSESTGTFEAAQFGVFLVNPKSDGDFRVALLWRLMSADIMDLVSSLSRIAQATMFVADWNRNGRANAVDYEYLGSHCCRIGRNVRVTGIRDDLLSANLTNTLLTGSGVSVLR